MIDVKNRAAQLHAAILDNIYRSTDRLFLWLMLVQWAGGIVAAAILSPRTYNGATASIHPHILFAAILGGLVSLPVIVTTLRFRGTQLSRFTVATCQLLMSALLIHISGGRIETHFHVFGSLAFLAFYRDWRILIPATLVTALDHMIRGWYAPMSVYGSMAGAEWRFIEHAAWVIFEDVILVAYCLRGVREVRALADRQAELEKTNETIEATVVARTDELRRTELRNSAILANALDGIISIDAEGQIVEFNPTAEALFGITESESFHTCFANLFADGNSRAFIDEFFQGAGSAERKFVNRRLELFGKRANGDEFPIELSISCLDLNGTLLYTAFIRDISERKQLEAKLSQTNKLQSIGQLATGVAHEINTPNQYIGDNVRYIDESFSELVLLVDNYRNALQDASAGQLEPERLEEIRAHEDRADLEFLIEEIPRALVQASEGVERVASIVKAMKEFSHPGIQSITMVDINRVVTSTVAVAKNEWKYVAEVAFDLEENLPNIQGNPGELGQVVLNLVVNAAHAIRDRFTEGKLGSIQVTTRSEEQYVLLSVRDNGGGIPAHVQEKMFDPFFTTKGVGIGTGQGLAIVHSVVVAGHNGEIKVETEVGEGTEFLIRIPIDGQKVAYEREVA